MCHNETWVFGAIRCTDGRTTGFGSGPSVFLLYVNYLNSLQIVVFGCFFKIKVYLLCNTRQNMEFHVPFATTNDCLELKMFNKLLDD